MSLGATEQALAARVCRRLCNRLRRSYRYLTIETLESRITPATHTWTGASGVNLNWSNAANWNGGVPTSGEAGGTLIAFPTAGAAVKSTVDDLSGLAVDQLIVADSGYTISGTGSNSLTVNGASTPSITDVGGGFTIAKSLMLALNGSCTFQTATTSSTPDQIAASINGNGGFTKTGALTLILSGACSYTGSTTVGEGTLQVSPPGGAGDVANVLPQNTDVTIKADSILQITSYNTITIGSLAGQGNVFLTGGNGNLLSAGGDGSSTKFGGVISGPGGFTKIGTGILTLGGASTLSGTISVFNGTLKMGAANALPMNATLELDSGAGFEPGAVGTLDLDGFDLMVGTLNGHGGKILLEAHTLVLSVGNFSGNISGTGGLTKIGTGDVLFSGVNSYTGPTQILQGTLEMDGTLSASPLTVAAGARLTGKGALGSVHAAGTIQPSVSAFFPPPAHTSPTTLGATNVSFSTGKLSVLLSSAQVGEFSQLAVSGPVNLNGAGLNVVAGNFVQVGDTFPIVAATSSTGTFANLPDGATFKVGSKTFQIHYSATGAVLTTLAIDPNVAFLQNLYPVLLGRTLDEAGLEAWGGQLAAGVAASVVVFEIETCGTQEYQTLEIDQAYKTLLHRSPDPIGLQAGLVYLAQFGLAAEYSFIAASAEYRLFQGSGTIPGWINSIYQDALGRSADPVSFAAFSQAVSTGALTYQQAADLIFASPEYHRDLVAGYYATFLQRLPDPGGLADWTALLRLGYSPQQVISGIAGSAEFFNRSQG
jgi:autotransporter-associated beta strand protein